MNGRLNEVTRLSILLAVLTCVPFLIAFSQQNTDRLKTVVRSMEDTEERVDSLLTLAKILFKSGDTDSCAYYNEEARLLAVKLGYKKGEAQSYFQQSQVKDRIGEIPAALELALELLERARSMGDTMMLGKATFQVGRMYETMGIVDSAIYFQKISLELSIAMKNTRGTLANYNLISNVFGKISEYDSAAFYIMKAIEMAERDSMTDILGRLYQNLGTNFERAGHPEEALSYYEVALKYNDSVADPWTHARIYLGIGVTWVNLNDNEKARDYYDLALEILQDLPGEFEKAAIMNNIAVLYQEMGDYDKALSLFHETASAYKRLQNYNDLPMTYMAMGEIYSNLGRYDQARIILDSAMEVTAINQRQNQQMFIYKRMAVNYSRMGDYKRAFDCQAKYSEIFEKVFNLEKEELIGSLTRKYEKEKDQGKILTLQNANLEMELDLGRKTAQRNTYLYTGLGLLILGLFLFLYLRQRVIIARQRIRQLEEENKLMEARLLVEGQELERKRIAQELHDGLGVLLSATRMQFTTLREVSPENRPLIEKATKLLEQASGDVRKISHNMMPGLLTKLGIYEAVEDLIENVNEGENISAVCEISGEQVRLDENKEIMVYRIIQEMVNNTLKHADARNIKLVLETSPESIRLVYSDDGRGFDPASVLDKGTGSLGLRNMQSRVAFLQGELNVHARPGEGVVYTLVVPV